MRRENITPTVLISQPDKVHQFARAYQEEARSVGRVLDLGQGFGVLHAVYTAANREQAKQIAEVGICGVAFRQFFYHFGFFDAWRTPEDEMKYPSSKGLLPVSECTIERMEQAHFTYLGTVADVRREMDLLVETANPEWFVWQGDQGLLPVDEVKRQIETFGTKVLPHYK